MGAGLALEFKLRFPEMFADYQRKVENMSLVPGTLHYFLDKSGCMIINFPTKKHFRNHSRLEWIEQGLQYFVASYERWNIDSIAFPTLGTGYGGLQWQIVRPLMERYLQNLNLEVVICLDNSPDPAGTEKKMVEWFNSINLLELTSRVRLSKPQVQALINNRPYRRFRDIQRTKGIGTRTYESIFRYVYGEITKGNNDRDQLKLF